MVRKAQVRKPYSRRWLWIPGSRLRRAPEWQLDRCVHQRARIAHGPAAGFDQRDEAFDHFVEQRRLLQIEDVTRFREEGKARGGQMLLQEQAGLDAIVVLVAAQDQCRRWYFPDRVRHGVDRGTTTLKAAHGIGRSPA